MDSEVDEAAYDGRWVTAWEAFNTALERINRFRGGPVEPVGRTVMRFAAEGYLPTATADLSHAVPIGSEQEKAAAALPQRREWRVLPRSFWQYFCTDKVGRKYVNYADGDWKHGHFTYALSDEKISLAEPLHVHLNAPGYHFCMARNVSFYEPGLWGISNPPESMGDGDRYPLNSMVPSPPSQAPVETEPPLPKHSLLVGGRPASKHGDAIAAATIRLAKLTDVELSRYTAVALASELAEDYRARGEAPPSERNCENYAAGILRVLRATQD